MSEPVVVISSPGEEAAARGLCAAIEARDGECWSPARFDPGEISQQLLDAKVIGASALVVVTHNALAHRREVELAKTRSVPVLVASPEEAQEAWGTTLAELRSAGAIDTVELAAKAAGFRQPRVYIADDEEKHIEFIAENVSEAQVFVRFGLFDKAIARLRTVLERAPRNLEAHDELLKIHLEENQYDEAAATAADYLDSLLFRGEEAAYAMLRSHLLAHGFAVDDGPPVAVGAAGGVFRTTRFHAAAAPPQKQQPGPSPARQAAVPQPPPRSASVAPEPLPLELPILRNFRPSQPVLESTGLEAELAGVDFLLDHGLLDEARMRVEQLAHEHPGEPGVEERRARLDAATGPRAPLALSLDDDWSSPSIPIELPVVAPPQPAAAARPTPAAPRPAASGGDELVCSIFCPLAVDEGDTFEIRALLHRAEETAHDGVSIVDDRREAAVLRAPVSRGDSLTLSLSLPLFEVDGFPAVTLDWSGEATAARFRVVAPPGTAESHAEGWLSVERDGDQLGDVPLRIRVA